MTIQIYFIFAIIILHNYIKNLTTKKIDYFKKKIDKRIVLIFIFNNIFFSIIAKFWLEFSIFLVIFSTKNPLNLSINL